jgi:hypothetical protein
VDETTCTNLGKYMKDFYEAPSLRKRGDTYYFVYAENLGRITDANHTPKRLSYATAKNIFGPYTYRGVIISVEQLADNGNIQGSIEQLNGQWYVFYHRAMYNRWNRRALCVEKIRFDKDGLIVPVQPSSSGAADGLNTSKPLWFNTAVEGSGYRFRDNSRGGGAVVNGKAEIGFRWVSLGGKERRLRLSGENTERIVSLTVKADGKTIGTAQGAEVTLSAVPKGNVVLTLEVQTNGETLLEQCRFSRR